MMLRRRLAGYAAFLFDFAHFGGSEGLPRHHVAPDLQLQNYVDAVKHIQVGLWRIICSH